MIDVTQQDFLAGVKENQGIRTDKLKDLLGTNIDRFKSAKIIAVEQRTIFVQKKGHWHFFYTPKYAAKHNLVAHVKKIKKSRKSGGENMSEEMASLGNTELLNTLWRTPV